MLATALLVETARPAAAVVPGRNGLIAFERSESGSGTRIFTATAKGKRLRQVSSDSASSADASARWSPDGTRLAFVRYAGDFGEIWAVDAEGANQRNLSADTDPDISPAWSPDGARIAYIRGSELWTMNADGSHQQRYLTNVRFALDWSPDGTRLVFERVTDGWSQIWVADLDDPTSAKQLTLDPTNHELPRWSPDGERIVFAADHGVWTIRADGTEPTLLTTADAVAAATAPTWSPDGRRILFTLDRRLRTINPNGGRAKPAKPRGEALHPDWQTAPRSH